MKWVEPTRDWFMKVGFNVMFDVPAKDPRYLGFVALEAGGAQVMLETRGNDNESREIRERTVESQHAVVFIVVDDLDAVIAALAGTKVLAERHTTFYGADEISYEEPGGHIVTFAKFNR
jgi:hypothetical protein